MLMAVLWLEEINLLEQFIYTKLIVLLELISFIYNIYMNKRLPLALQADY
jgi:hypothetical protein